MKKYSKPDFDNMDYAIKIIRNINNFQIVEVKEDNEILRIRCYEKQWFFRKKLVYTLTIKLLRDYPYKCIDSDFDEKFLEFYSVDQYGNSTFISNLGLLLKLPDRQMKDWLEEMEDDESLESLPLLSYGIDSLKIDQENVKILNFFKKINL